MSSTADNCKDTVTFDCKPAFYSSGSDGSNLIIATQCPTVVSLEINERDISIPLANDSDTRDCIGFFYTGVQHGESRNSCDLDNFFFVISQILFLMFPV